jgi:hypothetical protein
VFSIPYYLCRIIEISSINVLKGVIMIFQYLSGYGFALYYNNHKIIKLVAIMLLALLAIVDIYYNIHMTYSLYSMYDYMYAITVGTVNNVDFGV